MNLSTSVKRDFVGSSFTNIISTNELTTAAQDYQRSSLTNVYQLTYQPGENGNERAVVLPT